MTEEKGLRKGVMHPHLPQTRYNKKRSIPRTSALICREAAVEKGVATLILEAAATLVAASLQLVLTRRLQCGGNSSCLVMANSFPNQQGCQLIHIDIDI